MNFLTKASIAQPTSNSLRTTIPREVVELLKLEKGDNIQWIVENDGNGVQVRVKKLNL